MLYPDLTTSRLHLSLYDPQNPSHVEAFSKCLLILLVGPLKIANPEEKVKSTLEWYHHHGRLQRSYLKGETAERAAVWLLSLKTEEAARRSTATQNGATVESSTGADRGAAYMGMVSMLARCSVPDQGWVVFPEHQGQGYATEAAKEVLAYFRDTWGLVDAIAPTHFSNPGSRAVSLKCGYVVVDQPLRIKDGAEVELKALPGSRLPPREIDRMGLVDDE